MIILLALVCVPVWADGPVLPGQGFAASRYEALWTKSPFAVATAEAAPESPDYDLVGIAKFDGVYFASLVDKKSQEHFLVSADKPARGLNLISVTPGRGSADTIAVLQRGVEMLSLKLQKYSPTDSTTKGSASSGDNPTTASATSAALPMPGAQATSGTVSEDQPPTIKLRRTSVRIPPHPP